MQNYTFDIINARFVASGAATQAKGLLYRLRLNKGQDVMKQEDYKLGTPTGILVRNDLGSGALNTPEEKWNGNVDYWLGRTAMTDMVVKMPGEGELLINDVVMNVSLQKEIVKTSIIGRKGSIKEYITDGDYQISMSVGIMAVNDRGEIIDQYPERAVTQLREILERPEALEVNSGFLDLFNINKIVVTNMTVKQMTHSNRQVIEITAISDDDYCITYSDY